MGVGPQDDALVLQSGFLVVLLPAYKCASELTILHGGRHRKAGGFFPRSADQVLL